MIQSFLARFTNWLIQRYGDLKALRIIVILKGIKDLIVATFKNWVDDDIPLHGAALAFYTIFSLAPLLIIIIALSAVFFGEQAAAGQISLFLDELIGEGAANFVESVISSANQSFSNRIATIIGVGTIIFTSTTVITQLKSSLNIIWKVETREGESIKQFLISRFTSLILVLIIAAVLISTLLIDATFEIIGNRVTKITHTDLALIQYVNYLLFITSTIVLFSVIFKMLPDIKIAWIDAIIGAITTTLLFLLGRFLITYYLGVNNLATAYGAAGTFVIILVWIYYNSMVVFLGAEFTHQYTIRYGRGVSLPKHARFRRNALRPK
jgi:membrane protein